MSVPVWNMDLRVCECAARVCMCARNVHSFSICALIIQRALQTMEFTQMRFSLLSLRELRNKSTPATFSLSLISVRLTCDLFAAEVNWNK